MEIERNRETKYLEEERKIKLLDALERSQKTLKVRYERFPVRLYETFLTAFYSLRVLF